MSWWSKYWFRPAPLIDLSVVRIVAVMTQLVIGLPSLQHVTDRVASTPSEWYVPLPILELLTFPFGLPYLPSAEVVTVVWYVTLGFGVLALIGLLTNLSLIVFAIGSVFLQATIYSFGDFHHREAVMMITLGVLALSPAGATLSVDRLLRDRKARKDGAASGFLFFSPKES